MKNTKENCEALAEFIVYKMDLNNVINHVIEEFAYDFEKDKTFFDNSVVDYEFDKINN